MRIIFTF